MVGQKARMPRSMLFLLIFILLLAVGAFYLSSSARVVPTKTIEVDVSRDAPTR